MKKLTIILIATGLALTGCQVEDPDGEGAQIVDRTTAEPEASEPAVDESSPSDEPSPTPEEAAPGTRTNPLPLNTTARIGDWEVTILSVTKDANEQVMAENQFNDPPAEGRQFVMAEVEATYVGEDSGTFWVDMSDKYYGASGNTFGSSMEDSCGVIPNGMSDQGETFPDGTVTGNLCWSVPTDQIDGGAIIVEASFSMDSDRVFFAIE